MKTEESKDLIHLTGEKRSEGLAGVHFQGIYYYDMGQVKYINNSGIADLIDLVKAWLDQEIEVRFINVRDDIKKKIADMDLENILYCD